MCWVYTLSFAWGINFSTYTFAKFCIPWGTIFDKGATFGCQNQSRGPILLATIGPGITFLATFLAKIGLGGPILGGTNFDVTGSCRLCGSTSDLCCHWVYLTLQLHI